MARIQQQNPNNYRSSALIHTDFENLIRYLVSSERGNKSLPEMMRLIFDEEGAVTIDVALQYSADGIQWRLGADGDWQTLATVAELRGEPGRDVGTVPLPVITQRSDITATAAQTVFPYAHSESDFLFVFKNGLLLKPTTDYTSAHAADTVTLTAGASLNDIVTIYKLRGESGVEGSRTDTVVVAASQSVFAVSFPDTSYQEQVYLNGVLLAETTDYIISEAQSTITLTSTAVTDDVVTTIFLQATDETTVTGFMLEGVYTDPATGLIPYAKLSIADAAIPQAKVNGLVAKLATVADTYVGSSTPASPTSGDLWLDTSLTPSNLKMYDGVEFFSVQPTSSLPAIKTSDANYIVSVNSSGSGLIYKPLDFSSLVYRTERAAAGGVATLDGNGLLEESQRPLVRTRDIINFKNAGATADGNYHIRRAFGEKFRIIASTALTSSGTCDYRLSVSGVGIGSTYSVSSVASDQIYGTVIEVDAQTVSKAIGLIVSSSAAAADLEVVVTIERLI